MKLQNEIADLEEKNIDLYEKVEEIMSESREEIVTFEKGKYTDDIHACCYELLSLNVGVKNVKPVINAVLVDRLPGRSVLRDMMIECLIVAHVTLQTDGTTKFGKHFSTL